MADPFLRVGLQTLAGGGSVGFSGVREPFLASESEVLFLHGEDS